VKLQPLLPVPGLHCVQNRANSGGRGVQGTGQSDKIDPRHVPGESELAGKEESKQAGNHRFR
jgi:hypothetical protein